MKQWIWLCCLPLILADLESARLAAKSAPKAVIAYVFVKDRLIEANEISAERLTRINYAFANIRDGEITEGFAHDHENFAVLNDLKKRNPRLTVLISIGGWTWSGAFSDISSTAESRKRFIDSAVRFIQTYQLDGIDIDWEYPGLPGIGNRFRPEDKQNYTALLKELRKRLDREGKKAGRHFITSIATGASTNFLLHTEMNRAQRYVDTVNLMSYDYYEASSDHTTGNHAPLFTNVRDPKLISANASVKEYVKAGVPRRKIVLGVPFYGHAWGDVGETEHGLFQPGKEIALETEYRDIATLLKGGFVRYWDSRASAPYLYNPQTRIFVSYEDAESLNLKCKYVLKQKLGGIMFWEYHGDSDGALLRTIDAGLGGSTAK